jgi:hypothetical protein
VVAVSFCAMPLVQVLDGEDTWRSLSGIVGDKSRFHLLTVVGEMFTKSAARIATKMLNGTQGAPSLAFKLSP